MSIIAPSELPIEFSNESQGCQIFISDHIDDPPVYCITGSVIFIPQFRMTGIDIVVPNIDPGRMLKNMLGQLI
jgi:hypothetical protein